MTKFLDRYRIESIRMPGYDYSKDGSYYVTICTHRHKDLLCKIENQNNIPLIVISEYGKIVSECWKELTSHYPNLILDEFIIMPDHIHGIMTIRNVSEPKYSLSEYIRAFKSFSSRRIHVLHSAGNRIWQDEFYDRIIRSNEEFMSIREYIRSNPERYLNELSLAKMQNPHM